MIILAAGEGRRLQPLTNEQPKCMVAYNNKPIIDHILDTVQGSGIKQIAIVNGYKREVLEKYIKDKDLIFYTNKMYGQTNMVSTLFCAKEFMDDDLIISYADIVYKKEVLQKLIDSKGDFSVVIDTKWRELWNQRMENPLDDAETLKIREGYIIELGKKPKSYDDIEGQYIGLIKISKNIIEKIIHFYEQLDQDILYDGKDFNNMYMTSFIQLIIDNFNNVTPVYINGGWIEIDSVSDLAVGMINEF